ncbi:olfactory receptor 10A7-like [Tyto alba]|uniref:olfactory receptor 10A7-like n=1 Tax=Tyto alba TaxID=56313 RepID=UPI001401D219|nr:olfactory receptor 10A7-like [Tyto alba]
MAGTALHGYPTDITRSNTHRVKPAERPEPGNHTLLAEFVLSGMSNHPELQHLLFFTFCLIYTITIIGNLTIIMVTVHPTLRMPMYFFLWVLSVLDISTASIVVSKLSLGLDCDFPYKPS